MGQKIEPQLALAVPAKPASTHDAAMAKIEALFTIDPSVFPRRPLSDGAGEGSCGKVSQRRARLPASSAQHGLDAAHGLADPVLVLDEREPHVVVAELAEADLRSHVSARNRPSAVGPSGTTNGVSRGESVYLHPARCVQPPGESHA